MRVHKSFLGHREVCLLVDEGVREGGIRNGSRDQGYLSLILTQIALDSVTFPTHISLKGQFSPYSFFSFSYHFFFTISNLTLQMTIYLFSRIYIVGTVGLTLILNLRAMLSEGIIALVARG